MRRIFLAATLLGCVAYGNTSPTSKEALESLEIIGALYATPHSSSTSLTKTKESSVTPYSPKERSAKLSSFSEGEELNNEEINRVFLSFYEEYKREQAKLEEQKRRDHTPPKQERIKINTRENKYMPKVPSIEEQMLRFQEDLAQKGQGNKSTLQTPPKEPIERGEIFGVFCKNNHCSLFTSLGDKKVGDKINGRTIKIIHKDEVLFEDGTKKTFIEG